MTVLDVQLVQRLDMFVDKRNRNDDEVLFALFHVALERRIPFICVRTSDIVVSLP